jgi:predicted membrane-bound spermidine synthase
VTGAATDGQATDPRAEVPVWVPIVFAASGFAALIYQVVWQRVLYAWFGVNVEAVTIVVSAFLAGLGAGSLAGGRLAVGTQRDLLRKFGLTELAIAGIGLGSIGFFKAVGTLTLGLSPTSRGIVLAATAMLPTTLMGATLPILVEYVVQRTGNVGRAVGRLYFVNTAGSAIAAFAAVLLMLGNMGEWGSVRIAAVVNLLVGGMVLLLSLRHP